jgi:endo-1,4-beta-xylanase
MGDSVLHARVLTLLLPALVAVGCITQKLSAGHSLTGGEGGSSGADTSAEPGGAGSSDEPPGAGNFSGQTSAPGDGGGSGAQATGGSADAGQDEASGGETASGGAEQTGGTNQSGSDTGGLGAFPAGGGPAEGGAGTGGTDAMGGASMGGSGGAATGGRGGTASGGASTGGSGGGTGGSGGAATGGTSGSSGSSAVDCSGTMPTDGARHCSSTSGTAGALSWTMWSSSGQGCMTTYDTPAFSASWNEDGDSLARLGLEWGNDGKPYGEFGSITAQFAYQKQGTDGGYSFIGVYGWSISPCVEYYIVEDSFGTFPFNAYSASQTGTASIDGGEYKLFQSMMTGGTGGTRCGVAPWYQFWSIRQEARQCGQISVSEHFEAWRAAGMRLGNLLEVKVSVEVLGGTGSIDFSTANVAAQ